MDGSSYIENMTIGLLVVLLAPLAILCSMIASAKGKSGGIGCLAGFLFGIFALIYYACIPKVDKRD